MSRRGDTDRSHVAALERGEWQRALDLLPSLEQTIRTGTYCCYLPDPRVPTCWETERGGA